MLIVIRGAPAAGKSTLARGLVQELRGKRALLIVDEFRWVMTAHDDRDADDYSLAWKNYLSCLENYLTAGYTVVTEDVWLRKHVDAATDVDQVVALGERYGAVHQFLIRAPLQTVLERNRARPMTLPDEEMRERHAQTYAWERDEQTLPDGTPEEVLAAALEALQ